MYQVAKALDHYCTFSPQFVIRCRIASVTEQLKDRKLGVPTLGDLNGNTVHIHIRNGKAHGPFH